MLLKLLNYNLDCIKNIGRNTAFINLKSNKDNIIKVIDNDVFNADNEEIIKIMTKAALNKQAMSLIYSQLILSDKGIFSPLLFTNAELIRENDLIKLVLDDDFKINIGLISSLLENNEELIENTINELLSIDNPETIDFKSVLFGLIPSLKNKEIKEEKTIILAKMPEMNAGLINELKELIKIYESEK